MELDKQLENLLRVSPYLTGEQLKEKTNEIKTLGLEMRRVLDENENGVGISGIQLGSILPMILIKLNGEYSYYLNPIYGPVYQSPLKEVREGCLSLPGVICKVSRFKSIQISGLKYSPEDLTLKHKDETKSGLFAYVFQHEVDHIHGITILHKANYMLPERKGKRIYAHKTTNDFFIEGSTVTIFKKDKVDEDATTKNYIIGMLNEN